jgi:hypothetical protein
MMSLGSLLEYVTLAVSLALLVFGVTLLRVLGGRGGNDLALAHLVADSRRRRVFLSGLYTCLAALFAIGLAVSLELLLSVPSLIVEITETVLFLAGATGIFVLMRDALRAQPLTLEEGWNLRETAARGTMVPGPVPVRPEWAGPQGAGDQGQQSRDYPRASR